MPDFVDNTDRRGIIESALEEQEELPSSAPPPAPARSPAAPAPSSAPVATPAPAPSAAPVASKEAKTSPAPAPGPKDVKAEGEEGIEEEPTPDTRKLNIEKPPAAWRAPQRAKWATMDPDVRTEIVRRERDFNKILSDTAVSRKLHESFNQVVQPYQARINALGVHPLVAVQELLKADYLLSASPPAQRAKFMAKLINDYGVDILELDAALAGKEPADPVSSRVEQLLEKRLAPFQQFIQHQTTQARQAEEAANNEIHSLVDNMASDPKYPHFEDVRQDMADIIEMSAKRGVYLSPDQAYNRAVAMNPEVSKLVADQKSAEERKTAAQKANASAQQALSASVSVNGSPGGAPSGASGAGDRRSAIAAAFDSALRG